MTHLELLDMACRGAFLVVILRTLLSLDMELHTAAIIGAFAGMGQTLAPLAPGGTQGYIALVLGGLLLLRYWRRLTGSFGRAPNNLQHPDRHPSSRVNR